MLFGFENETAALTPLEEKAAETIARCLQAHIGVEQAITGEKIGTAMALHDAAYRDAKGRPSLTGARLRKIVNHIRVKRMCKNLIANSKGYYVSNDPQEIRDYVRGLRLRAQAIGAVADSYECVSY